MSEIISGISLLISFLCLIYLVWRFIFEHAYLKAVFVILIMGLMLRIIAASDPDLHRWDERYHALVAKNMVSHPLKPTLYEHPMVPYDNSNWIGSNIWLAKPVLPLLLMSGSIATFGANLFAVRFVSVLLGLLAIWLTYLIGKRLFGERVGAVAAFLHAIQGNLIELSGGRISSDHVELCFVVMVQLGVYFTLRRYKGEGRTRDLFFAGFFMGFAFLSKWYPAFLILPIWVAFFYTYYGFKWRSFFVHLGLILIGFSVSALPWTLYMLATYPDEMRDILGGAASAYSEIIQGHSKPWYYYLHEMMTMFGEVIFLPLIYFVYSFWTKKGKFQFAALLVWILLPLLIFSTAETKRFTYLLISAPAYFVVIAWFWDRIFRIFSLNDSKLIKAIVLIVLIGLPVRYTIERVKFFDENYKLAEFYGYSDQELGLITNRTLVFGTEDYIEIMFHTDCYAAYLAIPDQAKLQDYKHEGYTILIAQKGRLIPY